MGLALFWLFVLAACLLWSATFTAAAVRSATLPSLLSFAAWFIPLLVLLPAVWQTARLAFGPRPLDVNHFAATLTLALAALVGGVWIVFAGRRTAADGTPVARRWPVIGLAGLCGMAAMVAYGTLVAVDNAVAAEAAQARAEAAALMQANLPPAVAEADNAAPLHRHAAALLAGDDMFNKADFFGDPQDAIDIRSPEVTALLARHADTLDLIRRAADKNACRFDRDWSRPSFDMVLPEIQSLRGEARLLALAARRAAADGDAAAALGDTVRIHRIGRQAAAEPILISHLVALALDAIARDTLALVLPSLDADDLALLDDPGLDGLVGPPPPLLKCMLGEETFGLSVFADIATGRMRMAALGASSTGTIVDRGGLLYRTLFLSTDLAAYRELFDGFQQACAQDAVAGAAWDRVAGDEQDEQSHGRRGVVSAALVPSLAALGRNQVRAEAGARAARVLVAATKRRLAGGGLPESLDTLVPDWLSAVPRDPYTDKEPLRSKPVDGGMLVWCVGPDGEDDGGPPGRDSAANDIPEGNDDIGLWMVPDRPAQKPAAPAATE